MKGTQRLAPRRHLVGGRGRIHGAFGVKGHDRIDRRVDGVYPLEEEVEELAARYLLAPDRFGQVSGRPGTH